MTGVEPPFINGHKTFLFSAMDQIVVLKDVVKEYRNGDRSVKAVNGISLAIEKGSFVVVLGPSGSGKTTLLNIISGLVGPTSGEVRVSGRDIAGMGDGEATKFRAESIGFVFQFFNLFPTLTVLENVEIGLALKIKDPQELRARSPTSCPEGSSSVFRSLERWQASRSCS